MNKSIRRMQHAVALFGMLVLLICQVADLFAAGNSEKVKKASTEYHSMCGCDRIFFENRFNVMGDNHFAPATRVGSPSYDGQCEKIVTAADGACSELIIPDAMVVCFMAGEFTRLTGYFLTEPYKYCEISAKYHLDGENDDTWYTMEGIHLPGAPFWKKFEYFFDFSELMNVDKVTILAKSPASATSSSYYDLYLDEFRFCQYCNEKGENDPPYLLSKIDVTNGAFTESFDPQKNEYFLKLNAEVVSFEIAPHTHLSNPSGVVMKVNGVTKASGEVVAIPVDFSSGHEKEVMISLSKEECRQNIYVIHVIPALESDATLINLGVRGGELAQPFYRFTYRYILYIPTVSANVWLTPSAYDKKATITINGVPIESDEESDLIGVSGSNEINIIVTSRDGAKTRTYTLIVHKKNPTVSFTSEAGTGPWARENPDPAITAVIFPLPSSAVTVPLTITGSAISGTDYTLGNNTLTFNPEDKTYQIPLKIITTNPCNAEKNIVFTMGAPTPAGVAVLGTPSTFIYTITETQTNLRVVRVSDATGVDDASHDGSMWSLAKKTLQAGIDRAMELEPSDGLPVEIWVKEGTYYPSKPTDAMNPQSKTFLIPQGTRLLGGFAGTENDAKQRILVAYDAAYPGFFMYEHETILSGDISLPAGHDDGDINNVITLNADTYIDGFIITGGYGPGTTGPYDRNISGAGIYAGEYSLDINYCVFKNNQATYGAAIFSGKENSTNKLNVDNCIFKQNTINISPYVYDYGVINAIKGEAIVNNSLFLSNTATGVLIGTDVTLSGQMIGTVYNCDIISNEGAGVKIMQVANARIVNCTFNGNKNSGLRMISDDGLMNNIEIINCIFAGNYNSNDGAGIFGLNSKFNVINCTFNKNWCQYFEGGGISAYYYNNILGNASGFTVTNSILWDNIGYVLNEDHYFGNEIYCFVENENNDNKPIVTYTLIKSKENNL